MLTTTKTIATLFAEPLFTTPTKGTHSLKLVAQSDQSAVNFEWIGDDVFEGVLAFDKIPSAIAVALRAGATVELIAKPSLVEVKGITEGQMAMLVPRFYSQPVPQKQFTPTKRRSTGHRRNRDESGHDETYAFTA